jgi:hypothetical protein
MLGDQFHHCRLSQVAGPARSSCFLPVPSLRMVLNRQVCPLIVFEIEILTMTCSSVTLFITLAIMFHVRSEFVTIPMMIKFTMMYPFYLVITAAMGVYGHARQLTGYSCCDKIELTRLLFYSDIQPVLSAIGPFATLAYQASRAF